MRNSRPGVPDEARWESSLLSVDTEVLIATVRNYLGTVKTPYDKRVLVSKLATFLRRPETKEAILGLLDLTDARIVGTILLAGPATEEELRELFAGELRLFDLGLKIANLQDRLILFRLEGGRELTLAVNPILAAELRSRVLASEVMLGLEAGVVSAASAWDPGIVGSIDDPGTSYLAVALFGILFHFPASLKKSGVLSKRAQARVASLLPSLAARHLRLEAIVRGLILTEAFVQEDVGEGNLEADPQVFLQLMTRWGGALHLRMAAAIALEPAKGNPPRTESETALLADGLAAFLEATLGSLPEGLALTDAGLKRWLGIAKLRFGQDFGTGAIDAAVLALEDMGSLVPIEGGRFLFPLIGDQSAKIADGAVEPTRSLGPSRPSLVAEGSHILHVLPEADLDTRFFALLLAEPRGLGRVWDLEIGRESVRRALGSGIGARAILSRLETLTGRPLPQSLSFSINSWEEEHRSLRLFHGYVLVADERRRNVIEKSSALADLVAERLGEGIYVLAVRSHEEISSALVAAGLEAPPEIHSHTTSTPPPSAGIAAGEGTLKVDSSAAREASILLRELLAGREPSWPLDPLARIEELRNELGGISPDGEEVAAREIRKELADRIERRIILDPAQLKRAELRVERLEATGLDYSGKVRIVERALRSPGDRLDIAFQLPGVESRRVLLRPVRLEKSEKGLVLEAEDLATGGPIRVPLGSASTVRRLRASLFGDSR